MFVYFDQNGTLKEIVTEKTFRVGDSKRDKIYVYWDGDHSPVSGWVKYRKANGKEYPASVEECFYAVGSNSLVGKQLPTKPLRNLKYFSYDHTYEKDGETKVGYEFYEITVPDDVLNSSMEEGEDPSENNMVVARIRFVLDEGADGNHEIDDYDTIATMGALVFSVETSIGILTDSSINETQYNYFIKLLGTKLGLDVKSVKVSQLPSTGVAGTIYYVEHGDGIVYDAYFWNGGNFVFLGTTSYGLYTKEEGDEFEVAIQALWTAELSDYKSLVNSNLDDFEEEITKRMNDYGSLIQAAASGSPKDVYQTLTALENAYPNGTNGIFVVLADNKWYYWNENSRAWTAGGLYLTANLDAKSVSYSNSQSNGYLEAKNVQDAIDELIKKTKTPSTNLYNYKNAIDGKLVSSNMEASVLDDYPNSILSGFIPVEEGKSYVIKPNGNLTCGALFFWDENKKGVCAIDINGAQYGYAPYLWTVVDGLASVSGTIRERKITVLNGSGIKYVLFYVTNSDWNNYYGAHTDYLSIVKTIQVNEGTEALPFEPYEIDVIDVFNKLEGQIEKLEEKSINEDEKVYLIKNGNLAYFRSKFSKTKDLLWKTGLYSSANKTFNLMLLNELDNSVPKNSVEGVGQTFKAVADDVSPVYVNSAFSYLGANHGNSSVQRVTFSSAHGLSEKNIGEYWTDASNKTFLIFRIIDSLNINVVRWLPSSPDVFLYELPSTYLTNGRSTYNISSAVYVVDVPCCNGVEVKVFDEKGKEITDDGIYCGKSFQVRERYNIISVQGIVNYLVGNVGNNTNTSCYSDDIKDYFCEIENIYEFKGEKGSLTYYRDIYADKAGKYEIAGITSGKIGEYYSVPCSTASAITHQGSSENVLVNASNYTNADYPPASFYQYSGSNGTRGTNIGYNVAFGSAKAETRKNAVEYAINYYMQTYKMYPALSRTNVAAGASISTVAYQTFFDNYDSDIPAVTWYYVGDDIYLNVNCQATVDKNIELPSYMIGKKVTVVKTDGSISIGTDFVNAKGLRIKANGYGFATLKLS